ncbi:hypothetical protein Tco_1401342 [Tanacetum coccineum]
MRMYDDFSQHLSDGDESNHEDASDTVREGNSNGKLQKKILSIGKDGVCSRYFTSYCCNIQAGEKERKLKYFADAISKRTYEKISMERDDEKEIWEAIENLFCGNANSKKMQKAIFKQQFEAFRVSNSEGLEKGYDRFQQLLSQLEAHWLLKEESSQWKEKCCWFDKKKLSLQFSTTLVTWQNTAKGHIDEKKKRDSFYQTSRSGKTREESDGFTDNGMMGFSMGITY